MGDTLDIKIGGANTHFKTNDRSICLSFIFPFHNSSVEETMDGKEQDQVSMIRWHDDIQGLNTFVKMETVYKDELLKYVIIIFFGVLSNNGINRNLLIYEHFTNYEKF